MGNQANRLYNRVVFFIILIAFPVSLLIFAFSSCNVRQRSEKRECKGGNVAQCLAVGSYYEAKQGGIIAFMLSHADTAVIYYYEACKLESPVGCEHMLSVFEHGEQAKSSTIELAQVADVLIDACAKKVAGSCNELDSFASARDWASVRAAQAFKKRCDAGTPNGCDALKALLATHPGLKY